MSSIRDIAHPYLELCKVRVSMLAAFTAAAGFILSARSVEPQMAMVVIGVFLMACGASTLNQFQERDLDARMQRTKGRPVPSGRISPDCVLSFALILMSSGLFALLLTGFLAAPCLGLLAVVWYNGVYTHLKKKSAFAVVPGALVGTVPATIGWIAAGGAAHDPRLWMVCFFLFMWQVPHSWLFILMYGDEYASAGLPSLTSLLGKEQLSRINFIWMGAAAVSCLLLSQDFAAGNGFVKSLLCGLSAWIVWSGIGLLSGKEKGPACSSAFRRINLYLFVVLSLLSIDTLFH